MKAQKAVSIIPDVLTMHAQDLAEGEVATLHFDPTAAKQSCLNGLTFLEAHAAELVTHSPGFVLDDLRALPELCRRVTDIQHELTKLKFVRGVKAKDLIATAIEWRRKLMPIAQSLSVNGKLDGEALDRVIAGSGTVDNVTDVLDLVELLTPHRALVEGLCGKAALAEAGDAAREALDVVGIANPDSEASRKAADLRDRYATLIERRHDRLRVAIAVLTSSRRADSIVGSLFTNTKSKGKPAVEPEPVEPVLEPVS